MRRMRRLVGVGFRRELARWIASRPAEISCLEVTAEHFFDDVRPLADLSRAYPLFVHGLGLSLGTPGPLDADTLDRFARVVAAARPQWISEHVAFTRSREVDLGHLNPVRPTRETLAIVADHAREVSERCGRPLILENITSHVRPEGEMPETEFLNRLCDAAGCGLLLDVTNLIVNGRNHGFDPRAWLRELDLTRVVQLHVVGYSRRGGRWQDTHAERTSRDVVELANVIVERAPVRAIIIERDANFPPPSELAEELRALEAVHVA
jgi:hypothetical protein